MEVGKACRSWRRVLLDEQVWQSAFLQEWQREPLQRLSKSWRMEYIRRFRMRRVWKSGMQLACYRFRDVGGVSSARLSFDRRSLTVASPECLIHGILAGDSKLTRSSMYYSRTYDEEAMVNSVNISPGGKFAVGLDDGKLVIYNQVPTGTLSRNFSVFTTPNLRDPLPVQRIDWITSDSVVLLCRRGFFPTSRLIWWDVGKETVLSMVERNDVNSWCVFNQTLFWSTGNLIGCTKWTVKIYDSTITSLFVFGKYLVAASLLSSPEIVFISPEDGSIIKKITSESIVTHLKISSDLNFCLFANANSNIYRICMEEDAIEVTPILSKSLPTPIKDIAGDETIIIALCEDNLLIYDSISFELLRQHVIPGKLRRMSGPDLDEEGQVLADILSFDGHGRVLIRWGRRAVQFWNFGARIAQMDKPRRSSNDRTASRPTKLDIARDLNEDLEAFVDAQEETANRKKITDKFTLEGMSEAEMLQYAQLMSMEDLPCTVADLIDSEDEDLRLAIQLSLADDQ